METWFINNFMHREDGPANTLWDDQEKDPWYTYYLYDIKYYREKNG
jgi:hypothetical protein